MSARNLGLRAVSQAVGPVMLLAAGVWLVAAETTPQNLHNVLPLKVTVSKEEALDSAAFSQRVDAAVNAFVSSQGGTPAGICDDANFLRRVSLDLTGVSHSPEELTAFVLDPAPDKRARLIDRLLDSAEFGQNWSRYWRDVIYFRATEARSRLGQEAFEEWIAAELNANRPWSEIVTSLLTATGDAKEDGRTALMFAHSGEAEEIASEASRIFLGIQVSCANCHDHPTDRWTRNDFHELAAFFPRVKIDRKKGAGPADFEVTSFEPVQPKFARLARKGKGGKMPAMGGDPANPLDDPEKLVKLLDRNGNGKIEPDEASHGPNKGAFFKRLLEQADADKDGALTAEEIKNRPRPEPRPGRGSAEHFMPDLNNPNSPGIEMHPVFFVTGERISDGKSDAERRAAIARLFTSPNNPWFARAFVNRVWKELVGEGFYVPVDDIGPDRTATAPEVLDLLSSGFIATGYDVKWLFRVITNSQTYQRQSRVRDLKNPGPVFAAAMPSRLRADQIFDEITRVLGLEPLGRAKNRDVKAAGTKNPRALAGQPRFQFGQLFGYDPSATPDEIMGAIQQALFMMNSPQVNNAVRAGRNSRLGSLLERIKSDEDLVTELYLLVHSREPNDEEMKICLAHFKTVGQRSEAAEDLYWSLINSAEFQTRR
jgi:hypothetical protein